MGTIHRAKDLATNEIVAVKVMASGPMGDASRFAQEAVMLAELSHPSIVRYVAHGKTQAYCRERRWDMAFERAVRCRDSQTPWIRQWGGVLLAEIYLAQKQPAAALEALDRAAAEPPHGVQSIFEPHLIVVRAETFHAL